MGSCQVCKDRDPFRDGMCSACYVAFLERLQPIWEEMKTLQHLRDEWGIGAAAEEESDE